MKESEQTGESKGESERLEPEQGVLALPLLFLTLSSPDERDIEGFTERKLYKERKKRQRKKKE